MSHLPPDHALVLVTLPPEDPERRAAYAHADGCPACAALLREHEAMLRLLDGAFLPPEITPALAARVHASVRPRRWPRLVLLATWLASLALILRVPSFSDALGSGVGSHCALSEALFAVAPLGAGAWLSRAGRVRLDPAGFAAITGAGGLVGQWWLRNHCPVHGAALHSFVFHFLVVIALSLLGGVVGPRIMAART